ncbi:MAG TPA: site-specific DNA-methyltransferase [Gemmatimonadaceae bacterium]
MARNSSGALSKRAKAVEQKQGDAFAATHPSELLEGIHPAYATELGAAYCGDSRFILGQLPANSVDLVVTSPPYALEFKKEYGNEAKEKYVAWFLPFAREIKRVLKDDGSFVLNIGGSYNRGEPTRSLYHFRLLLALCDDVGLHLAQEAFWFNPAKVPAPAEWCNVRRIRVKDSVEYVWWLSATPWPKASNREVLVPYSADMERLIKKGFRAKTRPSGWRATEKWGKDNGGSIPSNLMEIGNNESNSGYIKACAEHGMKPHPARFPAGLPEWWTRFLTAPGDLVVDPFAGSNTTGSVVQSLGRRWISIEQDSAYVKNSALRFSIPPTDVRV